MLAKGKKEPVAIFEVLEAASEENREPKMAGLEEYQRGLRSFRTGDFRAATDTFLRCQSTNPTDKVLALYLERCETLMASGAADGNQVTELTEK